MSENLDQKQIVPTSDTPPPAAPESEEAELRDLYVRDQPTFEYAEWRDSGRTAAQRLYEIEIERAKGAEQDAAAKTGQEVAEVADDLADADDVDLDAPAEVGDAPEAEEGEEAEETGERLKPWEPPDGQEIAEHVRPHLEALDGIARDETQRDEIVGLYQKMVEEQTARLAEMDKAATKAAVEEFGGREAYAPLIDTAKSVLKTWPKELADAVRDARTSDGRRLALMPEFVRVLASMGDRHATPPPKDSKSMLQAELAEIDAAMHQDVANLYKPWKASGKLATDRRLEIARELASEGPSKPSASDLKSEERELLKLRNADPDMFRFGSWRGGRSASERLAALQSGRG